MLNVFTIQKGNSPILEDYYTRALNELNTFFGKNWLRNTPKLLVVNDRETINLLRGEETPGYVVGWNSGTSAIFILNPDNFATESTQNYSTEQIYKLIKHELAHAFYQLIVGQTKPRWLTEGLSLNVAEQLDKYQKPSEFSKFLDNADSYKEGGYAVKLLLDKFGKSKMIDFMESLKSQTAFKDLFEKNFEMELSYESFNSLSASK
jgi:hypothetical protein